MYKSGMLAADIPLYGAAADVYGAVPPAADAANWLAYAAVVTLAVLDGILCWAYTSCWVAGFGTCTVCWGTWIGQH